MKKQLISICIILLLNSIVLVSSAFGQEEKKIRFKKDVEKEQAEAKTERKIQYSKVKFFQGVSAGVDIFGLINKTLGGDYKNIETTFQVNLKNRYMPIVEIGQGAIDITNNETNVHFKTSAPYIRIGMDMNMMYKKPELPGYITLGVRLGHTSFSYDVNAPNLTDPNWKNITMPFSYKGVKSNANWLEIVVGVRAKIIKGLRMGWSVRYKSRLSMKKNENSDPYYIPGYGKGKKSTYGCTYNISYDLPF
ncbi:MAG: DUF6048 family protein [Phocaeicola sp.]|uniref:DUF6048 family protein n=1 Tax=Phocaeicola TaxID=909656 RepID=UPI00234E6A51|nr:DUF6048 family protein [Phocaeicola oris]MCE2615657.1 DUF6048 family protein [Phocaeicola oris]